MRCTGLRAGVRPARKGWRTIATPLVPALLALAVVGASIARADGTFRIGGPGRDMAWCAAGSPDGGIYISGCFVGTIDFDPETAAASARESDTGKPYPVTRLDAFLVHYDAKGKFAWRRLMGGSGVNIGRGVAVGGDGAVCVCGSFQGKVDFDRSDPMDEGDTLETRSGRDAFIACYDAGGEFLWVRGFGDEDRAPPGSKVRDVEWAETLRGITMDAESNVYAIGFYSGVIDLDPGQKDDVRHSVSNSRDIFVVSLDKKGNYRWGHDFGGDEMDQGHAVALGPENRLLIGGGFSGVVDFDPGLREDFGISTGLLDVFVGWLTTEGKYERSMTFGGEGFDKVMDGGLAVDAEGAAYLTGEFTGRIDVEPRPKKKHELKSEGMSDAFVVRYDKDGRLDWGVSFGGAGADRANTLCLTKDGGVAVGGRFTGRVDFAPGGRRVMLHAPGRDGASAAFVALFDEKGKLDWARALGAKVRGPNLLTRCSGVVSRPDGGLTVAGSFFGNLDVHPGSKTQTLTNLGASDVFIVQYDAKGIPLP